MSNEESLRFPGQKFTWLSLLSAVFIQVGGAAADSLYGRPVEGTAEVVLLVAAASVLALIGRWRSMAFRDTGEVIRYFSGFIAVCAVLSAIWPGMSVIFVASSFFAAAGSMFVLIFELIFSRFKRCGK